MKATDLSIGDIGKTFRSPMYRDNNKTSLPIGQYRSRRTREIMGVPEPRVWTLTELYAHSNGNIKINNGYHLRADTEIERVGHMDERVNRLVAEELRRIADGAESQALWTENNFLPGPNSEYTIRHEREMAAWLTEEADDYEKGYTKRND